MEVFTHIAQGFDVSALKSKCNVKGCAEKPEKELVLKEFDVFRDKKKPIGSLFLCTKHFGEKAEGILSGINSACPPGKAVTMRVLELGYITF